MRRRTLAGYLRTINYRRHLVTDTSLYTDLPSRLRAMALVLEGPKGRIQYRSKGFEWSLLISGEWSDNQRVEKVIGPFAWDYRLKPTPPARLYVGITDDGRPAHSYGDKMPPPPQMPGTTRVTYVLENPDAND